MGATHGKQTGTNRTPKWVQLLINILLKHKLAISTKQVQAETQE